MGSQYKRHCWECRRRCLVCDFTEPECKRCSSSRKQCPGYSDVKPVRYHWLTPGRTKAWRRRQQQNSQDEGAHRSRLTVSDTSKLWRHITSTSDTVANHKIQNLSCFLVEGAEYYNRYIYQDLVVLNELGKHPNVYPLSAAHVQSALALPEYLQYGMLCMILSHRENRLRKQQDSKPLTENFYHYWGLAVRSLKRHVSVKGNATQDVVLAGMMTLLLTEIQHGTSLRWRYHLEAAQSLIVFRGGISALAIVPSVRPLLTSFWSLLIFANTTCPSSDLIDPQQHLKAAEFLVEQYDTVATPCQMCPLELFIGIITITDLRIQSLSHQATATDRLMPQALLVLEKIRVFSPEQWSNTKPPNTTAWLLAGQVYQAAVALYCILSLQSLSVLPQSCSFSSLKEIHAMNLYVHLQTAVQSLSIRRFMIWPLILLGTTATHDNTGLRNFVSIQLKQLSYELGSYAPLTANNVLERFWSSGHTSWDACFDQPYVFTLQPAVDIGRMFPPS